MNEHIPDLLAISTRIAVVGLSDKPSRESYHVAEVLQGALDRTLEGVDTRAGLAFRYTETGPEGLLTGKRALVLRASAGTPTGADTDFATPTCALCWASSGSPT